MHLKKTKRNGRVYLSVVQNYRENGTTKTKTIETIGYADTFADTYPDPIAHFQAYVEQLNERERTQQQPISLTFARDAAIDAGHVATARWGSALALSYLDALGVRAYFEARAGHAGFPAHAGRIFEMFTSERMLHVTSKRESWQRRASFPRPCDFSLANAYEALSCFAHHAESLVRHLAKTYERIRGPYHASAVFLVMAPFAIADTSDLDSATAPAHAAEKLTAGVGVVLDETGMPMDYRITAANPTAHELCALVHEIKAGTGAERLIAVAGRTDHAESIMAALANQGDGFVLYRPMKDALPELQSWVADEQGYTTTLSGSYKVKSRTVGATKELVLWGRDYARQERKKRAHVPTATAPAAPHALEGYICIATSETHLSAGAIFHTYRELWRLIEPFQIMESDFSPSPYPVAHDEHLQAHFLMCYAAFFAMRLLRSDLNWSYNAAQVADALLHMEGNYLQENWFVFSYRDNVTDAIEQAAGVDTALRLRTAAGIRSDINRARAHIESRTHQTQP